MKLDFFKRRLQKKNRKFLDGYQYKKNGIYEIETKKSIDLKQGYPFRLNFRIEMLHFDFFSYLSHRLSFDDELNEYVIYYTHHAKSFFILRGYHVHLRDVDQRVSFKKTIKNGFSLGFKTETELNFMEEELKVKLHLFLKTYLIEFINAKKIKDNKENRQSKFRKVVVDDKESYILSVPKVEGSSISLEEYSFTNTDLFSLLEERIYPKLLILDDFSLVTAFQTDIHYCLAFLLNIDQQSLEFTNIDINKEIGIIEEFFLELNSIVKNINSAVDDKIVAFTEDKLNNILQNHHSIIKNMKKRAEFFNKI